MASRIQLVVGLMVGAFFAMLGFSLAARGRLLGDQRMVASLAATAGFLLGNGLVFCVAKFLKADSLKSRETSRQTTTRRVARITPVGQACAGCSTRIIAVGDAAICPKCARPYHHECMRGGGCPGCGGPPPLPVIEAELV